MADTHTALNGPVPGHVPADRVFAWMQESNPEMPFRPWSEYERLQTLAPNVFWSPESRDGKGSWLVKSYELCREVLQEHTRFTTTFDYSPGNAWPRRLIPVELDPPDHQKYRSLLTPLFAPAAIDRLESGILATTTRLIDDIINHGRCDFVSQFANLLPSTVFMQLLGIPPSEHQRCLGWVDTFFHGGQAEERERVGIDIQEYLIGHIEEKRTNPGDDVISQLVFATVKGEPIEADYVQDMCFMLFIAGLDTVTAGLGHMFRYLGEHPKERRQLTDQPDLIPDAVEELLRWNSFVNVPRTVRVDTELDGVTMKKGDHILVLLTLADRDFDTFEEPHEVKFHRTPNPHLAFSAGVHRCVGSHLARREIRVALEQWLARIPDFRVRLDEQIRHNPRSFFSIERLPLEWAISPSG